MFRGRKSRLAVLFGFCIAGIIWLAINLNGFSLFRRVYYYGDAKKTVERLREIYFPDFVLSANEIESRLRADTGASDVTRIPDSELLDGDLVLFRVNTMFTVGLKKDGGAIWIVDDVRAPEHGQ